MEARHKHIIRASWVSITGNALLAVLKITVGMIAGSMAVVADGIDSAGDILTSVITLITAHIMSRPPDIRYPYGYERADSIASKALSFVIFFAGAQLAISAVTKLIEGGPENIPSLFAIWVIILSLAGKVLLAIYQFRVGKKTGSTMLVANARNMQSDVMISLAVLTGLVFTVVLDMPVLDSITALAVSFWIMATAIRIFFQSNRDLMDGMDDPELYKKLFEIINNVDGAYNPHGARIRKSGNKYVIETHIEVDGNLTVTEAHKIAHQVERKIVNGIDDVYDVIVHIEPYGNDEEDEKFGISAKDI
ncbi:MAG: cation diffusion facilitator family transporter [Bacteroidales bacterium]|jgi:cation diffusion facilitator family transporter|nr:cation diffusion facilitator family transporter [Bacteroidales bacterium]